MNVRKVINEQIKINQVKLKKANLLALVLNFEKYWLSYSLSEGLFYSKEVRAEASKIVPLFYDLYGKKTVVLPDKRINDVDMFDIRLFIGGLEEWLKTNAKYPKVSFGKEYTNRSSLYFQVVFIELESQLIKEIGFQEPLSFTATFQEF